MRQKCSPGQNPGVSILERPKKETLNDERKRGRMSARSASRSKRGKQLFQELAKYEFALREWAGRSSVNAIWLISDPVGALRVANLGIDEAVLAELATVPHRELAALLRRNSA
jgi:hypothetical protein